MELTVLEVSTVILVQQYQRFVHQVPTMIKRMLSRRISVYPARLENSVMLQVYKRLKETVLLDLSATVVPSLNIQ